MSSDCSLAADITAIEYSYVSFAELRVTNTWKSAALQLSGFACKTLLPTFQFCWVATF